MRLTTPAADDSIFGDSLIWYLDFGNLLKAAKKQTLFVTEMGPFPLPLKHFCLRFPAEIGSNKQWKDIRKVSFYWWSWYTWGHLWCLVLVPVDGRVVVLTRRDLMNQGDPIKADWVLMGSIHTFKFSLGQSMQDQWSGVWPLLFVLSCLLWTSWLWRWKGFELLADDDLS